MKDVRSKELIEFDNLCDEHRERFGKAYGITFGDSRPLSEHIAILKEALRTGKPAEMPEFDYERIRRENIAI